MVQPNKVVFDVRKVPKRKKVLKRQWGALALAPRHPVPVRGSAPASRRTQVHFGAPAYHSSYLRNCHSCNLQ
jgi:hypothetical protein